MMARGRYYKNAVLAVVLALAISFATVVQAGAPCEGDGVNASDCSPDESEGSYNVLGMVNNRSQYLRDVVERLWRPAAAVQEEEEREGEVPMPSAASSTTRSLRSSRRLVHCPAGLEHDVNDNCVLPELECVPGASPNAAGVCECDGDEFVLVDPEDGNDAYCALAEEMECRVGYFAAPVAGVCCPDGTIWENGKCELEQLECAYDRVLNGVTGTCDCPAGLEPKDSWADGETSCDLPELECQPTFSLGGVGVCCPPQFEWDATTASCVLEVESECLRGTIADASGECVCEPGFVRAAVEDVPSEGWHCVLEDTVECLPGFSASPSGECCPPQFLWSADESACVLEEATECLRGMVPDASGECVCEPGFKRLPADEVPPEGWHCVLEDTVECLGGFNAAPSGECCPPQFEWSDDDKTCVLEVFTECLKGMVADPSGECRCEPGFKRLPADEVPPGGWHCVLEDTVECLPGFSAAPSGECCAPQFIWSDDDKACVLEKESACLFGMVPNAAGDCQCEPGFKRVPADEVPTEGWHCVLDDLECLPGFHRGDSGECCPPQFEWSTGEKACVLKTAGECLLGMVPGPSGECICEPGFRRVPPGQVPPGGWHCVLEDLECLPGFHRSDSGECCPPQFTWSDDDKTCVLKTAGECLLGMVAAPSGECVCEQGFERVPADEVPPGGWHCRLRDTECLPKWTPAPTGECCDIGYAWDANLQVCKCPAGFVEVEPRFAGDTHCVLHINTCRDGWHKEPSNPGACCPDGMSWDDDFGDCTPMINECARGMFPSPDNDGSCVCPPQFFQVVPQSPDGFHCSLFPNECLKGMIWQPDGSCACPAGTYEVPVNDPKVDWACRLHINECKPGYTALPGTGICCPPGFEPDTETNTCVLTQLHECKDGYTPTPNGVCCPPGFHYSPMQDRCVLTKMNECKDGYTAAPNGVCCPPGFHYSPEQDRCVLSKMNECKDGYTAAPNGVCCPPGFHYDMTQKRCLLTDINECADGWEPAGASGVCCPPGFDWDATEARCVLPINECLDGWAATVDGRCCPVGMTYSTTEGRCMLLPNECPQDRVLDPVSLKCLCSDPLVDTGDGHCCELGQVWGSDGCTFPGVECAAPFVWDVDSATCACTDGNLRHIAGDGSASCLAPQAGCDLNAITSACCSVGFAWDAVAASCIVSVRRLSDETASSSKPAPVVPTAAPAVHTAAAATTTTTTTTAAAAAASAAAAAETTAAVAAVRKEYEWRTTAWRECDQACGAGRTTRHVTCVRIADGHKVADALCAVAHPEQARPYSMAICYRKACSEQYLASEWSACSAAGMGGSGVQTRTLACIDQDGKKAPMDRCADLERPATTTTCWAGTREGERGDWDVGVWSACSAACGGGSQTRAAVCRDAAGTAVDAEACTSTKPLTRRACNVRACEEFDWEYTAYGSCSATCGGVGVQSRVAYCAGNHGTLAVSDTCTGRPAGPLFRSCAHDVCPRFHYVAGDWGRCNARCGSGTRARTLACVDSSTEPPTPVDGSHCSEETRPAIKSVCNSGPCHVSVWQASPWGACDTACGGERSRTVRCLDMTSGAHEVFAGMCTAAGSQPPNSQQPCADDSSCPFGDRRNACGERGECSNDGCDCDAKYTGTHCEHPVACADKPAAVVDASGACCDGVVRRDGTCCEGVLDAQGECCASGVLDACGVCDGPAKLVDVRGVCCEAVLDAAGVCCESGNLDACGVCDGVGACIQDVDIEFAASRSLPAPYTLPLPADAPDARTLQLELLVRRVVAESLGRTNATVLATAVQPALGPTPSTTHALYSASLQLTPAGNDAPNVLSEYLLRSALMPAMEALSDGTPIQLVQAEARGVSGVCGNSYCEVGERCAAHNKEAPCCPADCHVPTVDCPVAATNPGVPCNGMGRCIVGEDGMGACSCFLDAGYTGEACDECATGYHRTADDRACSKLVGASCHDGVRNGKEVGIDCGGDLCPPCPVAVAEQEQQPAAAVLRGSSSSTNKGPHGTSAAQPTSSAGLVGGVVAAVAVVAGLVLVAVVALRRRRRSASATAVDTHFALVEQA